MEFEKLCDSLRVDYDELKRENTDLKIDNEKLKNIIQLHEDNTELIELKMRFLKRSMEYKQRMCDNG